MQILSPSSHFRKGKFAKELITRKGETYYDLGLRIEYIIRKYHDPNLESQAKVLGKDLLSSGDFTFVRIYESSYRLIYSSDSEKLVFQPDLRLGGLEIEPGHWAEDSQRDLLYRNSEGKLYFQISKEDADRVIAASAGIRKSYLPREAYQGFLYIVFQRKGQEVEVLETNLTPDTPLLPTTGPSSKFISDSKKGGLEMYSLLSESSKERKFFHRPTWEKIVDGPTELFLSFPRNSQVRELLLMMAALGVSFLVLFGGLLASSLFYSIRTEARFVEREDWLKLKLELLGLFSKVRDGNR
ncbi:hypothetical protein LEP1GSC058_3628 [Leptospira fainei serovar Hurstbridge str. BUT 6]|uniref:Uncharacterized protein n=1 Tax=Leptospira fainei serovar Hurstbridge str. BUT 6 TaxID=1193011 RepID=S3VB53_9LEPT|nr:hypothetical protein [Leptospira fainei]EPG73695.1 hypothetical protein LEP1GSC058_3628 [Leptospira fainei serovar Hurstbridge str. BUT 6]